MSEHIALLVDGDNLSSDRASVLMDMARRHGTVTIARVYADACNTGWHDVPGYALVHAGRGKNASDILLALDAMDLGHAGTVNRFALVSSDGDFRHLAVRLRDKGKTVVGLGEAKTPETFRSACTIFHEIAPEDGRTVVSLRSDSAPTELDRQVCQVIDDNGDGMRGTLVQVVGAKMFQSFQRSTRDLPQANWRGYFSARPTLYDVFGERQNIRVRYRQKAFGSHSVATAAE